ncbi:hypothetical protein ACFLVC_02805 [Chloroflexota bacterium]
MARAVIELSGDISSFMPQMYRAIEGCAYNQISQVAAFRYDYMRVIVERSQITIYGTEDKNTVKRFIAWLTDKVDDAQ